MSSQITKSNQPFDQEIQDIVDYALNYEVKSELAYKTAWSCLIDTIGCGLEALEYPACTKLLGPLVPGTKVEKGVRVPGTNFELDVVQVLMAQVTTFHIVIWFRSDGSGSPKGRYYRTLKRCS